MTPSNGQRTEKKRLLQVTPGNLRHSHVYVNGHYNFFPADCIGGAKRSADGTTINIRLDGLDRTIKTDIGRDAKTGKPRGFFRAEDGFASFSSATGSSPAPCWPLNGFLSGPIGSRSSQPSRRSL